MSFMHMVMIVSPIGIFRLMAAAIDRLERRRAGIALNKPNYDQHERADTAQQLHQVETPGRQIAFIPALLYTSDS